MLTLQRRVIMINLKEFSGKDLVEIKDNEAGVKIVKFICGMHETEDNVRPFRYEEYTFEKPLTEIAALEEDGVTYLFDYAKIYTTELDEAGAEDKLKEILAPHGNLLELGIMNMPEDVQYGYYIMSY